MRYLLLLALLVFTFQTLLAQNQPLSKNEYCKKSSDPHFFQKLLETHAPTRMSFYNHGGLFNLGVCWWHSLFQRNALYLTYYSPQKERPSYSEVKRLIRKIRLGRSVVEIPGFTSFYEFSFHYTKEIQHELNYWQIHDGVLLSKWFPALTKPYHLNPKLLKAKMDDLYLAVKKGRVVFQMLQFQGVVAHGWLVTDVVKTEIGYDLKIIESNEPNKTLEFIYQDGDSYLNFGFGKSQDYKFVPYTDYEYDLNLIYKSMSNFCKKEKR